MALPETDLTRIKKWCDSIWPKHMWDQARVEADVAPTYVAIVEVRPDWMGGPEPTRFPIARLRYTKATGQWAIYWRDRNLKFHEYRHKRPSKNVQSLLDYIREGKDPIFLRVGQSPRPMLDDMAVRVGSSARSGVRRIGFAPSTMRSGSTAVWEMS